MRFNKVEYSTSIGPYCNTHDIKLEFCMSDFSFSKIIVHRFHVDNYEDKSIIIYDMIIFQNLMVQIVLSADFKHQVLQ